MTDAKKDKNSTHGDGNGSEKPEERNASSENVEIGRGEYEELLRKAGEFSQIQDRLLRAAADFDNAKKRLNKERDDFFKFAMEGIVFDFLPVLDNLERALSHLDPKDEKTKSMADGFRLIQKQFVGVLGERGLKRLDTLGKTFDPHLHESIGCMVVKDKPEGLIIEEMLAGYELNGKLIRPAKVKVTTQKPGSQTGAVDKEEELT